MIWFFYNEDHTSFLTDYLRHSIAGVYMSVVNERKKNILMAGVSEPSKFFQGFDGANISASFHSLEICTANSVVVQCLTALKDGNPFDIIVIDECSGRCFFGEVAIKMMRMIPAYENIPIIVSSFRRYDKTYKHIGASAWIHYFACADDIERMLNFMFGYSDETGEAWIVFKEAKDMAMDMSRKY